MKSRLKRDGWKWLAKVKNKEGGMVIESEFNSDEHSLEQVLHKVGLDLMTNLHYDFLNPVEVSIKRVEVEVEE